MFQNRHNYFKENIVFFSLETFRCTLNNSVDSMILTAHSIWSIIEQTKLDLSMIRTKTEKTLKN